MKLRGDKLKALLDERKMTAEQLAEALVEPGMTKGDAERALTNWMAGRDHPRCKSKAVKKLGEALGVAAKDLARFTSSVKHHRGSPRKARLLADLVRGKRVDQAQSLLTFTTKRAAVNIKKALLAAIADAEQNEADVTRLFVVESRVDEGPRIKRFQPKDRGRAHAIVKPLSHITIGLEEK